MNLPILFHNYLVTAFIAAGDKSQGEEVGTLLHRRSWLWRGESRFGQALGFSLRLLQCWNRNMGEDAVKKKKKEKKNFW